MLQKEAVVPKMIDLIKELQSNSLFKDHVLVGGTALSLQLGHRTSTDIDLFTTKTQDPVAIINYFKKSYKDIDIGIANDDFIRIFVNNIKIEMVQYDEMIFNKINDEEGIKYLDKDEIAIMKINAILRRTEPRDFIDIAYLLKDNSLENMFGLYKKNIGSISPLYIKRTLLTKSKNIKDNGWLIGGIKMLKHDIEPKDVPKFIEQAIEEYNKNVHIGNNDG